MPAHDANHKEQSPSVHAAKTRYSGFAVLLIIIVTALAFAEAPLGEFVSWDDNRNFIGNEAYLGLSLEHLERMFTVPFGGHYQPLTWLSFALESRLWDALAADESQVQSMRAAGYHFTNLVLHVVTAVIFFFVARRLIARATESNASVRVAYGGAVAVGALVAALFFAVHPLRVESVAWATERRDVLSGAWLMLTTLFYLRAAESARPRGRAFWLGGALLCYVLSLLAKATGMTWPVVLLVLDLYPLRRFSTNTGAIKDAATAVSTVVSRHHIHRLIREKLLFVVPAALFATVAVFAQSATGAVWSLSFLPLSVRVAQAVYGIAFYVWKTLLPSGLIALYEQPVDPGVFDRPYIVAAVVVVVAAVAIVATRRRWPGLLACACVYVVVLSPVLGLLQSGPQLVADRYSYISCLPWAVLLGFATARIFGPSRIVHRLATKAVGNSAKTGDGDEPRVSSRAGAQRGSPGRATLGRAGVVRVLSVVVLLAMFAGLVTLTRAQVRTWSNSVALWSHVLRHAPHTVVANTNYSVAMIDAGDYEAARIHASAALARLPDHRRAHIALARASAQLGDLEAAAEHYHRAIELKPVEASIVGLAEVLFRMGRYLAAETYYARARDLSPESAAHWHNLGVVASYLGSPEAADRFQRAIKLDPHFAKAYYRLGILLHRQGDETRAIEVWSTGLDRSPGDVALLTKLAWTLATSRIESNRDGKRAHDLAYAAVGITGGLSPRAQEALAAAFAELGDFDRARGTLERVSLGGRIMLDDAGAARIRDQLATYRDGRPFRDEPFAATGDTDVGETPRDVPERADDQVDQPGA